MGLLFVLPLPPPRARRHDADRDATLMSNVPLPVGGTVVSTPYCSLYYSTSVLDIGRRLRGGQYTVQTTALQYQEIFKYNTQHNRFTISIIIATIHTVDGR